MNNLLKAHDCRALMATLTFVITQSACAQDYNFSVINTSFPQTTNVRPYSITDSGTILVQQVLGSPLLVNGNNITYLFYADPYTDYVSYSSSGWLIGNWPGTNSTFFVEDPFGNFTGPSTPGYSICSINNFGIAVGMLTGASQVSSGFVFQNGVMTPYNYPGSTGCSLNAINNLGDMAGTYFKDNNHMQFFAFMMSGGKNKQVSIDECIDPNPSGMNDAKQLVGSALLCSDGSNRVVGFWKDGKSGQSKVIDYSAWAPKISGRTQRIGKTRCQPVANERLRYQ